MDDEAASVISSSGHYYREGEEVSLMVSLLLYPPSRQHYREELSPTAQMLHAADMRGEVYHT